MTKITIPDFSLVVLVGPSGSGKSSFARKHFLDTEVVSSDQCRAIVSDDENDQSANTDTFALVHYMAGLRLKRRKLTVIDSTAVQKDARAPLVKMAKQHHALAVAIVLDIDHKLCAERNEKRENRNFGAHVPRNHSRSLRRDIRSLKKSGFSQVHIMKSPEEVDALEIERVPLYNDKREQTGPFDIIGDIHGCFEELTGLLVKLGYEIDPWKEDVEDLIRARHPEGRRVIFVGDITDRGPRNIDALRLVMGMVDEGSAQCVVGNHDDKLKRWLQGRNVKIQHGLETTVAELEHASKEFRDKARSFLDSLISHHWLDGGNLVIAHAGLKEEMHGRGSGAVRSFAMYGDTTGEVDEFGLPVRLNWAKDYRGKATVVYGHTPVLDAEWLNETICIDTGCVFGGKLTALRWPERTQESVPAKQEYAIPSKPMTLGNGLSIQQIHDKLLFFDELVGKKRIETRYKNTVIIPEQNNTAALEITSRFAVDPRWLIYTPPTMAPSPTTLEGPWLEHPEQAIQYYAENGIKQLVAEEKHMGSRALLVVCRNAEAAQKRFGVEDGKSGVVYTRTGRPFFKDDATEAALIDRVGAALENSKFWTEMQTDWVLLDAELMPWSAKASELLQRQYTPAGLAAYHSANALIEAINKTGEKIEGLSPILQKAELQKQNALAFQKTLQGYCWNADAIDDYKLAPFHILATEGKVHADKPHSWHMQTIEKIAEQDAIISPTRWRVFDPTNEAERKSVIEWWIEHTEAGQEGMVIKPEGFIETGPKGYVQPAMKVRGRDYLRIIYGPDYDLPENIERLRKRGLGRKWSLAWREFSLGLEGLHRFTEHKPLMRVHECALGVLALESEPVDPRL